MVSPLLHLAAVRPGRRDHQTSCLDNETRAAGVQAGLLILRTTARRNRAGLGPLFHLRTRMCRRARARWKRGQAREWQGSREHRAGRGRRGQPRAGPMIAVARRRRRPGGDCWRRAARLRRKLCARAQAVDRQGARAQPRSGGALTGPSVEQAALRPEILDAIQSLDRPPCAPGCAARRRDRRVHALSCRATRGRAAEGGRTADRRTPLSRVRRRGRRLRAVCSPRTRRSVGHFSLLRPCESTGLTAVDGLTPGFESARCRGRDHVGRSGSLGAREQGLGQAAMMRCRRPLPR